jgi:hypothetical protein
VNSVFVAKQLTMDFRSFRRALNAGRKAIIDFIVNNYIERIDDESKGFKGPYICMFGSGTENLTKEHVIPRWAFDKNPKHWFTTSINGLKQTYEQTTLPCCATCNNVLLNDIEKEINSIFTDRDLKETFLSYAEMENVIAWLELIDYKFQVISISRQFLASKDAGYIPFLADYPISVFDPAFDYSPAKVIQVLRQSLKRMGMKSKKARIVSLVIFKTSNPSFHFFHKMNDFIYLEMPHKKAAIFYFYTRDFDTVEAARDVAMELISANY